MNLKTSTFCLTIFLIVSGFVNGSLDKAFERHLIQIGETLTFSFNTSNEDYKRSMSLRKATYDGSKFNLHIDTGGNLTIRDIQSGNGSKQDEFILFGCTGSLFRNSEQTKITFKKNRHKYYLIDLDRGLLLNELDSIISINLVSTSEDGNPGEYYCTQKAKSFRTRSYSKGVSNKQIASLNEEINIVSLKSVPPKMRDRDLYQAIHEKKTLAHFSLIEIQTSERSVHYIPGSYILCEGNSLKID